MREEAEVLNALWDWATKRMLLRRHPYDFVLAQDMQAMVRSYNKGAARAPREERKSQQ